MAKTVFDYDSDDYPFEPKTNSFQNNVGFNNGKKEKYNV